MLAENARTGGRDLRNKHYMMLTGVIHCASCDRPMLPTYTKRTNRLYRYYVCRRVRQEGWAACATKSVPAETSERLIVEQVRAIGIDPEVFEATLAAVRARAHGVEMDAADLRRALSLWTMCGRRSPRRNRRAS